jgi:hypothetical protein
MDFSARAAAVLSDFPYTERARARGLALAERGIRRPKSAVFAHFQTYGRTPRLVFRVHTRAAVFRLPRDSSDNLRSTT